MRVVAEQNMVSVAAGLAKEGFRPWVYSIAPFLYGALLLNRFGMMSVCTALPVILVGNGGRFTDTVSWAALIMPSKTTARCFPFWACRVYLPACDCDLSELIRYLIARQTILGIYGLGPFRTTEMAFAAPIRFFGAIC